MRTKYKLIILGSGYTAAGVVYEIFLRDSALLGDTLLITPQDTVFGRKSESAIHEITFDYEDSVDSKSRITVIFQYLLSTDNGRVDEDGYISQQRPI